MKGAYFLRFGSTKLRRQPILPQCIRISIVWAFIWVLLDVLRLH